MQTHFRHLVKPLAVGLCLMVALPFEGLAQQGAQQDGPIPTQLNIVVVEGEGATSQTHERVTPEPLIRVEDENHKPIVGASIVFILPTEGATGEFANGSKTLTIMTDERGQAAGKGLRVNQYPGKIPIHVTASYKGLSARTIFTMESVLPPGAKAPSPPKNGGHGKLIVILVIVGAVAAGGAVYFLEHKSGSNSSGSTSNGPTPIGITPGTGTIGGN
jgi:hypothetical protein